MSDFLNDAFTGSGGTLLAAHSPDTGGTWTQHPTFATTPEHGTLSGAAGTLYSATGNAIYYNTATPATADYSVFFTVKKFGFGAYAGVAGRMDTSDDTMYLLYHSSGDGEVQLAKRVSGVSTVLSTYTVIIADGDSLELRMSGTSLLGFLNGVQRVSATDSSITAKGKAGTFIVGGVTSSTGVHLTSITGTDAITNATTYTLTGPSSGTVNVASTNFTITPNGPYTGTITITPSGGGLSTPIVKTFSASATPQTFTITPTVRGTVTLTPTNNGGLTNPSNLTYASQTVLKIACLGDSITRGGAVSPTIPTTMAAALQTALVADVVTAFNYGTDSTATPDWQPGVFLYDSSKSDALSHSCTVAVIALGVNDSKASIRTPAATYKTNIQTIVNDLLSSGFTAVYLCYPTHVVPGSFAGEFDATSNTLLQAYGTKLAEIATATALVDIAGGPECYQYFIDHPSELNADGVHPLQPGANAIGALWATGYQTADFVPTRVRSYPRGFSRGALRGVA